MPARVPHVLFVTVLVLLVLSTRVTFAHCDSLDGPVVKAAQTALETGDVRMVLPWVPESSESEISAAFRRARAVRTLGADATALADLYFYETVVRVHRAGEGEPYTGLKPAGQVLEPAIAAADRAIATGAPAPLIELVTTAAAASIRERFEAVLHAQREATPQDVAAGRRFVAAYVSFVHHVERLFETATTSGGGHPPEVEAHGHASAQ